MLKEIEYKPVKGKTYTLFSNSDNTDKFYIQLKTLADECLNFEPDIERLINIIRTLSKNRKQLKRVKNDYFEDSIIPKIYKILERELSKYTTETETHLKNLSFFNGIRDKRLRTTREQYYLYMLEFELVNRLNIERFKVSEYKIALLPYCLHDLSKECKAKPDDLDYICKRCSGICFLNHTTQILKQNNIHAYIWMSADLKHIYKKLMVEYSGLGVLGIACIPELVNGMRKCIKYNIPVVGIPLDANCCRRWFGEFHDNSVNLVILEKLIS